MHTKDTLDAFTIADSIKYGRLKRWYPYAQDIRSVLKLAMPHARKKLDLPKILTLHVAPLRKATAVYNHRVRRVTVDPRKCKTIGAGLISLMHELVHAEQFNQGRLALGIGALRWNGSPVIMETRNYTKYRAQPWEQEAFSRELDLARAVAQDIADATKSK